MKREELIKLQDQLIEFQKCYQEDYPLSTESAQDVQHTINEIINHQ